MPTSRKLSSKAHSSTTPAITSTALHHTQITQALIKKMEGMRGTDGQVKYPSLNKVLLKFTKIERYVKLD